MSSLRARKKPSLDCDAEHTAITARTRTKKRVSHFMTQFQIPLTSILWPLSGVRECFATENPAVDTVWAMEKPHACSGSLWPTSFSPRGATLSCCREMNTLAGVDRALRGDYTGPKKHEAPRQKLNFPDLRTYELIEIRLNAELSNWHESRAHMTRRLMWDVQDEWAEWEKDETKGAIKICLGGKSEGSL